MIGKEKKRTHPPSCLVSSLCLEKRNESHLLSFQSISSQSHSFIYHSTFTISDKIPFRYDAISKLSLHRDTKSSDGERAQKVFFMVALFMCSKRGAGKPREAVVFVLLLSILQVPYAPLNLSSLSRGFFVLCSAASCSTTCMSCTELQQLFVQLISQGFLHTSL